MKRLCCGNCGSGVADVVGSGSVLLAGGEAEAGVCSCYLSTVFAGSLSLFRCFACVRACDFNIRRAT